MRVCLAVVCIGQTYISEFEELFKPSLVAYTNKYGYDLKVFTDFLDSNRPRPSLISFQKALVPSHESLKDYDLVVVIDADIYIGPHSPPIHTLDCGDKIGIVNELGQLSPSDYTYLQKSIGIPDAPIEYYRKSGFSVDTKLYLNSGLMLCTPSKHGEFLKSVYTKYVSTAIEHPRGFHYEQSCIGYELIANNMVHCIPNGWNHIFLFTAVLGKPLRSDTYFVHFAGLRGHNRASAVRSLSGQFS